MDINTLRLLLDFGLLILIWMVQLVLYPSFAHYVSEDLVQWHKKYTLGISYLVVPLMLGQLVLAILQGLQEVSGYTVVSLVLISGVWITTFLWFVPMHNTIASGKADSKMLKRLVKLNWWRTFLWTVIFCWSSFNFWSLY